MYPVVFAPGSGRAVVAGRGEAAARRLRGLEAAGFQEIEVFSPEEDGPLAAAADTRGAPRLPAAGDFAGARLVLIAGLDEKTSARLSALAREAGVPVNVEDRPALSDFHIPAVVRRGDLLLTVSTGGRAPGLSSRLRERLEALFGPEWEGRVKALAAAREGWKRAGDDIKELSRKSREWLDRQGWFK